MRLVVLLVSIVPVALSACRQDDANGASARQPAAGNASQASAACEVVAASSPLPREVRETSGLARSGLDPGRFWTHNDAGNEPLLFAIDTAGRIVQSARVSSATLVDWEAIESAPCADGAACLYVGDIGDNDAERAHITVYRVREPEPGASATAPAEALHARYPDGPRDAEALFVDGAGRLHVVTKGRREEIAIYRYPTSPAAGSTSTLERVRVLFPRPENKDDRVTAATSTPDRRWVGIRTYRTLYLFPASDLLTGAEATPTAFDLSATGETQGEALVIADDGTIWTSSEAENRREQPRWSRLRCEMPAS